MSQKVALVTGAAAGIGAAICRRLARDGIAVGVLDINLDDATKVASEIDGRWFPMRTASDTGEVAIWKTMVHPDPKRPFAAVAVAVEAARRLI